MNNTQQPWIWSEYHDMMIEKFFYVCRDKNVLEIAPMQGSQTQAIVKCPLKSLTLVEAYRDYEPKLKSDFPSATVVMDDIFKVYQNQIPADVVVCCGLLYHLHNAFYLLELIANQSNPEYIILDSINMPAHIDPDKNIIEINHELVNKEGERISAEDWKSVGFKIVISFNFINNALEELGYKCIEYTELTNFQIISKIDSWMAMWKKLDTLEAQ